MLLPEIVICAQTLADYYMLKFLASMSYIYIYIYFFFFPQLKHYDFKNTPIYEDSTVDTSSKTRIHQVKLSSRETV